MPSEEIRDAHAALVKAIAELREAGIAVPMALHLAVHSLSYALSEHSTGSVLPFKPKGRQQ